MFYRHEIFAEYIFSNISVFDDTLYTDVGQPRKRQMDSDRRATWRVARKKTGRRGRRER